MAQTGKKRIKLSELKINPANPRIIKDLQFKKLVESIRQFPKMLELRPIIYDPITKHILGGNMRFKALEELKYESVPAEWVLSADKLTEEEKQRFIISDNIEFGEWDYDKLANEWEESMLDMSGFDLSNLTPQEEAHEDDYEIPDEIQTDIKLGDLFQIGRHRLLCGDSTMAEDLKRLMDEKKADMVFTDPPYGVAIGKKNRFLNSFQPAGRNLKDIKDDNVSRDDLYHNLVAAFTNLKNLSNDCCTYFVTAPQGGELGLMMMMMMQESGLKVRHVLMWYKNAPTFSLGRLDYEYQHEPILLTWNKTHKFYGGGQHKTSVWKIDKPRSNKEHPTMKPVALVENALLNNSKKEDVCVDIYMGSGTTMVACEQLNRICYGIEIEPKYCQVIIDRMKKLNPEIEVRKL